MQLNSKLTLLLVFSVLLAPAALAVDINDTYALRYYSDSTLDFEVAPNGDTDITGDLDMGSGQAITNYFEPQCGDFRAVKGIYENGTWICTDRILEEKTEYLNETLSAGNTANVSIEMQENDINGIGDLEGGSEIDIESDLDMEENNILNISAIQDGGSNSIEFQEDNDVRVTNGNVLMNGNSIAEIDNLNLNGGTDSLSELYIPNNGGSDQFNIEDTDGTGEMMRFRDSGDIEIPNGNLDVLDNDINVQNGNIEITDPGPSIMLSDTDGGGDRPGISFSNNSLFRFSGDGTGSETSYRYYSTFSSNRDDDASFRVYGSSSGTWGNYIRFKHTGSDGLIDTDTGDLRIEPSGDIETDSNLNMNDNNIENVTSLITPDTGSTFDIQNNSNGASIASFNENGDVLIPNGKLEIRTALPQIELQNQDISGEDRGHLTLEDDGRLRLRSVADGGVELESGSSVGLRTLPSNNVEIPNGNLDVSSPSNTGGALDVGGDIYMDGNSKLRSPREPGGAPSDLIGYETGSNTLQIGSNSTVPGELEILIPNDSGTKKAVIGTGSSNTAEFRRDGVVSVPNGNLQMNSNSISQLSNLYDNETNANFFQDQCDPGNVIRGINSDGTYNCVASQAQIQDLYVNESGDNMTGNLDMNGNQVTEIGSGRTNFTTSGRLSMGSEIDMNGYTIREAPRVRTFQDMNLDIDTNDDETDRSLDITSDDETNSIASFNEQSIDFYKNLDMNDGEVQNVYSNSAGDAVNRSWVNKNIVNGTFLQRSYTGKFVISGTGEQDITDIPFQPDQIEFTSQMPVEALNTERAGLNGDDTSNFAGTMTGYARQTGFGIEEFAMSSGVSGDSVNNIRQKSTESASIAMSYGDTNGAEIGAVNASVVSLNGNGFTIDVREFDIDESGLVVQYTAFRATNYSTGDGMDVSDDGSLVLEDATDVNFANQIKVSNDGDGSVTVDKEQSNLSQVLEEGNVANQSIDMNNNDINNADQITLPDNSDPSGKNMLQIGDDSFLTDVDSANRLGVYGVNDNTVGEIQLGSSGPVMIGQSDGDLELSNNLQVGGNQIFDSGGNTIMSVQNAGRRNIYDGSGNNLVSVGGDGGSDSAGLTTIQSSSGMATAQFTDSNEVDVLNGNLNVLSENRVTVQGGGGTSTYFTDGSGNSVMTFDGNGLRIVDQGTGSVAHFYDSGNVEIANGNLDLSSDLRTSGSTVIYDQSEGEIIANPGTTSSNNPVFTRNGDKDTGIAFSGPDTLQFTTGGTGGPLINSNQDLDMSSNIVQNAEEFRGASGTSGDPLYTFSGDRDTGVYSSGADGLGIATGAATALNVDSSQNINVSAGNLRLAQVNSALRLTPSSMGGGDSMRINFSDPDGGTDPMSIKYEDDGSASLDFEGGGIQIADGNLNMNSNNITGTTRVQGVDLDATGNGISIDGQDRYAVSGNSLDDDEIADNSLTNASIDSSGSFTLDQLDITGDLTGSGIVDTDQLATSSVTSAKIGADEVQNVDIANSAVDTDQIAENAVTNFELDNADAFTLDGLNTTSNINVGGNIIDSGAGGSLDLEDDDGTNNNDVTLEAVNNAYINIDSNDNTGSAVFAVGKDANDLDGAGYTQLANIDEAGNLGIAGDFDLGDGDLTDINRIEGDDSNGNFFQDECSTGNMILGINSDGSYDCVATEDQINDIWVNESGDNMTGDLNMNANRMRDVGIGNIQIGDGEGKIDMNGERIIGGSMIQVDSLGITSSETIAEDELSGNSIYVSDDVSVDGNVIGAGADVAEKFENTTELGPGTVVQVTGEMQVDKTDEARDTDVVGVVSTDAFIIMAKNRGGVPVAMSGTAPVNVVVEDGEEIMPGDFLTTAERDGWAKKCVSINSCTGAIIGKAMESQDKTGKVSMLVSRG